MSKDFWFPWYPALFKADTRHLTAEQDGIYRRLLDEYMETREPLPDSDIALARIAGVNEIKWLDAKRIVIAYFTHKNGMYFHKKCDQELDIQDKKASRRSQSGERAAKKRWQSNQTVKCAPHTNRIPIAMRTDATDTDTDIINNKKKSKTDYSFDGSIIKLNKKDYLKWRDAFNGNEQEFLKWLSQRDDWLDQQPSHVSRNWFLSTTRMIFKS